MKWMAIAGILLAATQAAAADPISIELPDETILIERNAYVLPGTSFVNTEGLDGLLKKLNKQVYMAPRNAVFSDRGGILPGKQGQAMDEVRFVELMYSRLWGEDTTAFPLPLKVLHPRVDSELLLQITERQIGRYVTYYNARNKNRSHNIALAAEAIDNTVVFPGETFSFNRVVGKRTKDKGYMEAPIIVKGELSEGVGGGICQVSSTLFNAVDRAGMAIVQRYSHSRNVTYVGPGRDATVSWYGPDFVFRNPYSQPVIIRAKAGHGAMVVTIYSSDTITHKPRRVPPMARELPEETAPSRVWVNEERVGKKGGS